MSQPWYVVQRTFRGYTRTTELSLWGRVFVPCVLLQGLLTTGLSVALALIATDCLVSIVLAMLTLTILFAAYFAVEAVRTENVFQLCAYIGASSAGTLGIVLSISQRDDAGQDLRTAFMSPSEEGQLIRWLMFGAASLQLLSFLLALLTCSGTGELRGFGMRTYKKVGTDPALIRRYRRYQQFCSGLKLDLLFQAGVISLCVLGFDKFSWQWWLTLGMHVPLGFLWLPLGLGGVRRESVAALRLLLVLGAAQPIVLGVQLCTHVRHEAHEGPCTRQLRRHFPFESHVLDFAYASALLTRLLLLALAAAARANFGHGLRERVHLQQQHLSSEAGSQSRGASSQADSCDTGGAASFFDNTYGSSLEGGTMSDALLDGGSSPPASPCLPAAAGHCTTSVSVGGGLASTALPASAGHALTRTASAPPGAGPVVDEPGRSSSPTSDDSS